MNIFNLILDILTIAGSLGVFLYGMILMSESLQKVAGRKIRKTFSAITSNKVKGILSGTLITSAIQSSSATTVMTIGFVNAGLLSLSEAMGVIMGANIGTTATPWLVSILGFGKTFNINVILLPLIALSLPLLFSGKNTSKSWAEFIIGFAILFLGLGFLKDSIPALDESSALVQYIRHFENFSFTSVLLFVGIGFIFTIFFQSSSAVMAFTFVIASDGWISYEMAAAMVLGENIGTTITANIAAFVANYRAKRAALFHLFFNVFGVIWFLLLYFPLLNLIAGITEKLQGSDPFVNAGAIPLALAIFHSGFNISNTLILLPFTRLIERYLNHIFMRKDELQETHKLVHINSSYLSTSEISIVLVKKEISAYASLVKKMYDLVPEFLMEKRPKKYDKLYHKIKKYEDNVDEIEVEIANYLTRISEGKLSIKGTKQVRSMLNMINEIESMGDACNNMANSIRQKNKQNLYFIQEQRDRLNDMFSLIDEALNLLIQHLNLEYDQVNEKEAISLEEKINELRDRIKEEHIINLKEEKYTYQTGIYYIDLVSQLEKMGDYIINVTQSVVQSK
ncbi:MAG: Na/Pi cotransporter family protein [Bacteroidetes bacterium]|nr:Na/Pi cotransporter family protein [Bacteroidota bacterium]